MAFFCVLRDSQSNVKFDVLKLDINFWLLPGLGRRRLLCDIGVKLEILEAPANLSSEPVTLQLGLPFHLENKAKIADLSGLLHGDGGSMANLVFGNTADPPRSVENKGWIYDDGEHELLLTEHLESSREIKRSEKSQYTLVRFSSECKVRAGEVHYMRLRFVVGDSDQVWSWQRIGFRRTYAIGDFRVNEFRELPIIGTAALDVSKALPVARINLFFVLTSKLKAGRVSPAPRYVRVLERNSWEKYLQRKLSRKRGEVFVITYWRSDAKAVSVRNAVQPATGSAESNSSAVQSDAHASKFPKDVSPPQPISERRRNQFRSFLEVERRRPTAARFAIIAASISILGFILASDRHDFQNTVASAVINHMLVFILAGIGAITATAVFKVLPLIPKIGPTIRKVRDWLEDRKYSL